MTAPEITPDPRFREMIARLVAFPTVSAASNLDLIGFVREHLASHGIESRLVYNQDGNKANLLASVGPAVRGGVVLSGHTDVVPVEGQAWASDPFRVVERQGRLYGRGTADMKSFLALALALVPEMLGAGLKRPIHLALTYDEEIGCLGAPRLIERLAAELPAPEAVFVGEPTSLSVATAHKGFLGFETLARGREVHASQLDRGVSAVAVAARLVTFLDDMTRENRKAADPASPFDPPYTTLHCGWIEGGKAHNITAGECRFVTDIRSVASDDPRRFLDRYAAHVRDVVEPEIRAVAPEAGVDVAIFAEVPPLRPEPDGAAERLARSLTGDNGLHVVSFAAEAGQYQAAGFSTVLCGPGSIDQAHQPNEFISLEQVAAGAAFLRRLIARLAA